MAAAMRLIPCTASRREVSCARRTWILDPFLHSTPTPKAPYAQIIKAEPQVQHRQARLHRKNCHPRPVVLWHLSILLQQLIPIYPNIRQQTWHRESQCGVFPDSHSRWTGLACKDLLPTGESCATGSTSDPLSTVHLNRRSAPVIRPLASTRDVCLGARPLK